MPLLETTVAAVGRLALAAAYDRPALARVGPRAADGRQPKTEPAPRVNSDQGFPEGLFTRWPRWLG